MYILARYLVRLYLYPVFPAVFCFLHPSYYAFSLCFFVFFLRCPLLSFSSIFSLSVFIFLPSIVLMGGLLNLHRSCSVCSSLRVSGSVIWVLYEVPSVFPIAFFGVFLLLYRYNLFYICRYNLF